MPRGTDAPRSKGTDQPASGPEGDAQDLGQLADGGYGVREEVINGRKQVGSG